MGLTAETLDQLQGEPGWLRERRETALANFETDTIDNPTTSIGFL